MGNRKKSRRRKKVAKKRRNAPAARQAFEAQEMQDSQMAAIMQRARVDPRSLSSKEALQLQQVIGNRAVNQLLQGVETPAVSPASNPNSRKNLQQDQVRQSLPASLKSGVEALSKMDMSDVQVYYNSLKPAQLDAWAYTRGTEIFVGPGQEKHLPHEAWHIVQQKQGRVSPTGKIKGTALNDDRSLEREADKMGGKAARTRGKMAGANLASMPSQAVGAGATVQRNGKKTSKEIIDDMIDPTVKRKGPITAQELKFLLREAALAAIKTYAYHATKSKNVSSIMKGGLDPNYGGTGAAKGNEQFEEQSKNKVHYTRKHGLASDYKKYFEGDTPFGKDKVEESPGPAEILQIALHKDIVETEEIDPDSKKYDKAFTTTKKIGGKNIKSTSPKQIPEHTGNLKKGANSQEWVDYVKRGDVENDALFSNMSKEAQNLIEKLVEDNDNLDKNTLLQMLKQGLKSMKTGDILELGELMKMGYTSRHSEAPTGQMPKPDH